MRTRWSHSVSLAIFCLWLVRNIESNRTLTHKHMKTWMMNIMDQPLRASIPHEVLQGILNDGSLRYMVTKYFRNCLCHANSVIGPTGQTGLTAAHEVIMKRLNLDHTRFTLELESASPLRYLSPMDSAHPSWIVATAFMLGARSSRQAGVDFTLTWLRVVLEDVYERI